jgi:uncharacterized membrane protein (DUF4010 family)
VPSLDLWTSATGLAAALGSGLLIGLERERRKRGAEKGPGRPPAGIRSFALAALGGAIAQTLQQPWLVALGAALVAVLVAIAYGASRQPPPAGAPPVDPGLTTELALFVTYLVGVLAVQQPVLGAGAAAVVTGLLAARERLHQFAKRALSDAEWHDALVLAALVLVLLPLAPTEPLPWLAGLAPRSLLGLMALILALQAAGHVALRLLGPRTGLAGSGAMSGFVSSTATIASMGARAKAEPALAAACTAGAIFSTAATWVQAMLLLGATAPAAAALVAPGAAAGLLAALATGVALLHWAPGTRSGANATANPAPGTHLRQGRGQAHAHAPTQGQGPLRLREALIVTLLLVVVAASVTWAQGHSGAAGVLTGTALGAIADAHAPVAALGALYATGQLDAATVRDGTLVAIAANACTRSITAFVAGRPAFGWRVAGSLLLSTAAAATVALLAA